MKRTISTIVLFVLLILTVVALTQLGRPTDTHASPATTSNVAN